MEKKFSGLMLNKPWSLVPVTEKAGDDTLLLINFFL